MRTLISAIAIATIVASSAQAGRVSGYYRRGGTYVAPHFQSSGDRAVINSYSYRSKSSAGTTGNNRYTHDLASPYINGTP
jgi:hypothetical protein